jgi:alkanesulfonate monooxygenase SsuD/methylene tetrahydromethanopterin reductase-like flavin-dependent oxidoreductase (luciferase family)
MLEYSVVGSPKTVRRDLESFVALTKADELMVVSSIYDHVVVLPSCRESAAPSTLACKEISIESWPVGL